MLIQQDNLSSLVSKVAQMKCPVYMALYLIQKFELFFLLNYSLQLLYVVEAEQTIE